METCWEMDWDTFIGHSKENQLSFKSWRHFSLQSSSNFTTPRKDSQLTIWHSRDNCHQLILWVCSQVNLYTKCGANQDFLKKSVVDFFVRVSNRNQREVKFECVCGQITHASKHILICSLSFIWSRLSMVTNSICFMALLGFMKGSNSTILWAALINSQTRALLCWHSVNTNLILFHAQFQ